MNPTTALAISAGVMAGLSVPLTSELGVPAWLVFLAWSTYFFCGQRLTALRAQLPTNLWGVIAGLATFGIATYFETSVWVTGGIVAITAFTVAKSSRIRMLSTAPGSFIGFAMMAASVEVRSESILHFGWSNPAVLAVSAVVLGSLFAIGTELITNLLSRGTAEAEKPTSASPCS
uniref:DUF1097 domain-containing protein n=1 Tax=Rhodococcus sp. NS1 TaxID=402236 RepID=A0A097SQP3_9NOCA|nr:hypothetical protein LRS1606.396 [Rhodococcus sp. NS1]